MLLKKELENLEIKNKDLYMMKKLSNIWVNINLKNYRNKDLENDFIIILNINKIYFINIIF